MRRKSKRWRRLITGAARGQERDGVPHICIPDGHGYPVVAEAMTTATRG